MSEEDALLAAIAAQPEEDTPRLAYADWLDEHDRHAHAEFIRVQIDIARIETLPRIELNKHIAAYRRQHDLLHDHRAEFLGPYAHLPDTVRVFFHRGFVSELTLDCERLLSMEPEEFVNRGPLPEITVTDVAWWLQNRDTYPRQLWWVSAIEMQSERRAAPVTFAGQDEFGERFAFHGPFERLQRLNLERCRIGGTGVIAGEDEVDYFPALTDLDLSNNDITDEGVRTLVESRLWPRLERLVLGGNPLTNEAAQTLADAAGTSRLEHLNLRYTQIDPLGQRALLARFGGRIDLF